MFDFVFFSFKSLLCVFWHGARYVLTEVGPTAARLDQAIRLGQGRPSSRE
jgi:hypothetical protein